MIVRNGYVLDPESGKEGKMDIRIRDGVICEIGSAWLPKERRLWMRTD